MSDGMYVGGGAVVAPPAVAAAALVVSSLALPAIDELMASMVASMGSLLLLNLRLLPGVVAVGAPALLTSSFFLAFGSVGVAGGDGVAPVAAGPGSTAVAAAYFASASFFNLS